MLEQKRKVEDSCPEWADVLLAQLYEAEVLLGNIPAGQGWSSQYVESCAKRTFEKTSLIFREDHVDLMFSRLVKRLAEEQFSVSQTVEFINNRLKHAGSPPYCNQEEVNEVLRSK